MRTKPGPTGPVIASVVGDRLHPANAGRLSTKGATHAELMADVESRVLTALNSRLCMASAATGYEQSLGAGGAGSDGDVRRNRVTEGAAAAGYARQRQRGGKPAVTPAKHDPSIKGLEA